ncbi:hypothetical protein HDU93_006117, partial [Gonapodya sp. JEL0774]
VLRPVALERDPDFDIEIPDTPMALRRYRQLGNQSAVDTTRRREASPELESEPVVRKRGRGRPPKETVYIDLKSVKAREYRARKKKKD